MRAAGGRPRILAGRTGALIVLGYDRLVESLCNGGFALDVALSATRLRELAKMDGAVIVSSDGTRAPPPELPPTAQGPRGPRSPCTIAASRAAAGTCQLRPPRQRP